MSQETNPYRVSASCEGLNAPPCTRIFDATSEADAQKQAEATFPAGSAWKVVAVEKLDEQALAEEEGAALFEALLGIGGGRRA